MLIYTVPQSHVLSVRNDSPHAHLIFSTQSIFQDIFTRDVNVSLCVSDFEVFYLNSTLQAVDCVFADQGFAFGCLQFQV